MEIVREVGWFESDLFVGQNGVIWYIFGFYSYRASVELVLERYYPSIRYGQKWLQTLIGTLKELCVSGQTRY